MVGAPDWNSPRQVSAGLLWFGEKRVCLQRRAVLRDTKRQEAQTRNVGIANSWRRCLISFGTNKHLRRCHELPLGFASYCLALGVLAKAGTFSEKTGKYSSGFPSFPDPQTPPVWWCSGRMGRAGTAWKTTETLDKEPSLELSSLKKLRTGTRSSADRKLRE